MGEKLKRGRGEAKNVRFYKADSRRKDVLTEGEFQRQIDKADTRLKAIEILLENENTIDPRQRALLEAESIYLRKATGRLNSDQASVAMEQTLSRLSDQDKEWLDSPSSEDRFLTRLQLKRNQVINPITGRLDVKN